MIKFAPQVSNIVIIGCGGVASWAIAPLIKLLQQSEHKPKIVLVDGDTIEERNLERQWFSDSLVGENKAVALEDRILGGYDGDIEMVDSYYSEGTMLPVDGMCLFLGCADNHSARRSVLNAVDVGRGWAIIAGNEYTEAEAYYYEMCMKDTALDPRVYYPAILTDHTGDPTAPRGCTGLAAEAAPQLVLANFSAANHLLWMVYHHFVERPYNAEYMKEYMPIRSWNLGPKFITTRACDLIGENKS